MRVLAVLCVLVVCSRYSSCLETTNTECRTFDIPVLADPNVCIHTTLVDCANLLAEVTVDFDADDIVDWTSGEIQVTEGVEVCYEIQQGDLGDGSSYCEICARLDDVDATGDGATFDPVLILKGGPSNICGNLMGSSGGIKLDQVQVGSDCNDYMLKSTCFLHDTCGWCEATKTCESVNTDDGSPHCANCPAGWELAINGQPSNGGNGGDGDNSPANEWVVTDNSLALGLGLGIPLALLVIGACCFFVHRRNKKLGTGGAYDFERHSDENSRSDARGTRILIADGN